MGDEKVYLTPAMVVLNTVDGQTYQLNIALSKLWTQRGCSSQLGGADRRVVPWVREQDAPAIEGKISKSFNKHNETLQSSHSL